jgi:hypothetical protein
MNPKRNKCKKQHNSKRINYTEVSNPPEPEKCSNCGSTEQMDLRQVSIGNQEDQNAWICDACGFAHINR